MSESDADSSSRSIRREIIRAVSVALGLVLVLAILAQFIGFLRRNLSVGVALVFLAVPYFMVDYRGRDPERFGMTAGDVWKGLAWGLGAAALTVLPFIGGYWLWETQWRGRTLSVSIDNLEQWSVSDRGRPKNWGDTPGIWTWAEERRVHVGLKRGDRPLKITIDCQPTCRPTSIGDVELSSAAGEPRSSTGQSTRWLARVTDPADRAHLTIDAPTPGTNLAASEVKVTVQSPDGLTIYRGHTAAPVGDSTTLHRSFTWILFWLLTQIALIAIPEEFFYRGYLQTRCRDWLSRRNAHDGSSESTGDKSDGISVRDGANSSRRPAWLGITPENAVTSTIFALGHLLIPVGGQLLANRAAVFFPALAFGWLRDRTGYITAPVVYHVACNMMVILAAPHFYA